MLPIAFATSSTALPVGSPTMTFAPLREYLDVYLLHPLPGRCLRPEKRPLRYVLSTLCREKVKS
jgi:hypothetical protein